MSIRDTQPQNRNFLSPLNFSFKIKKLPNVNFFSQRANVPGFNLSEVESPNPFVNIPYPGDHIKFEPLIVSFKVDEDLQNYLEISNWLRALGKPENFGQYASIEANPSWTGNGIYSDASLLILDSDKNPNYSANFIDVFPTSITSLNFNTIDTTVNYIEATATFKYTYFDISKL